LVGHGAGFLIFFYAPTSNDTFKLVSGIINTLKDCFVCINNVINLIFLFFITYEDDAVTVDAGESHGEGAGKNITVPINLSKAGAKPGDQGVLQSQFVSNGNYTFQCADIKVVAGAGGSSEASSLVGTFEVTFFIAILASIVMVL
jgi:hypothetical protein